MNELRQLSKRHPVFNKAAPQAFRYLLTFPVLALNDEVVVLQMVVRDVILIELVKSAASVRQNLTFRDVGDAALLIVKFSSSMAASCGELISGVRM